MTEIAPQAGDTCRAHVSYRLVSLFEPGTDVNPPSVDDPGYHLRYWSTCSGCGYQTPLRSSENAAAEDGCDHAYPGWRDMPVMRHRAAEPWSREGQKWEAEVRRVYPAEWLARSGPVREERWGGGTRHVPCYAPGNGYLMAVMRGPGARPRKRDEPAQGSLFEGGQE